MIAQTYLLPPPRLAPVAEAPPHTDRLRLAANPVELPDEIECFVPSHAQEALAGERLNAIIKQALATTELRERLMRTRWTLVGGAVRADAKEGEGHLLVVVYDYTHDVAVEARVDPATGKLLNVSEAVYQPPSADAEIAKATELAQADQRITAHVPDLTVMAIPLDPEASGVAGSNHRVIEILFGCPQERLPRYRAVVDLSAERVVWAGGTEGCCGEKEHRS